MWTITTEIVLTVNFQDGSDRRHSWPGRLRERQYPVPEAAAATTAAPIAAHRPNAPSVVGERHVGRRNETDDSP